MNLIVRVAERVPEVVEKTVTEGGELIIAPGPNIIAPQTASALPMVQILLGIALVASVGIVMWRFRKLNFRSILRI